MDAARPGYAHKGPTYRLQVFANLAVLIAPRALEAKHRALLVRLIM